MSCCAVTGQGAGITAALSLKTGRKLDEVRVTDIHKELENQGVRYT